jgi:hypothetical protein
MVRQFIGYAPATQSLGHKGVHEHQLVFVPTILNVCVLSIERGFVTLPVFVIDNFNIHVFLNLF